MSLVHRRMQAAIMGEIAELDVTDSGDIAQLLGSSFQHDFGLKFVFRTPSSRRRWQGKVFAALARMVLHQGKAMGVRVSTDNRLAAVSLWFLPDRPFPPAWYRSLTASLPLLPMVCEYPTYLRYERLCRFYTSLMPRGRRLLYLTGLAVDNAYRGQRWGTRLVEQGQHYATDEGCAVFVQCWAPLVPYYERLGFVRCIESRLRGIPETCHGLLWEPAVA